MKDPLKHTRELLRRSPGICPEQLHVVHDKNNLNDTTCCGGVHLHRFAGTTTHLGNDQRWDFFQAVLQRRDTAWQCAYAMDLDASVLCLPPCVGVGGKLLISSDMCGMLVKQWLFSKSQRIGHRLLQHAMGTALWSRLLQLLVDQRFLVNCGVVGGHRSQFLPALASVVRMYHRIWHARDTQLTPGTDMILWNGVAIERGLHSTEAPDLITGYPFGPANWPLYPGLLAAHQGGGAPGFELCLNVRHSDAASGEARRPCNTSACVREYASNVSLSRFHFAHKLPSWWLWQAVGHVERTREGTCQGGRLRR